MDDFYISCQNSRIENNKSFYGSFCLGSFDPSLSITIANSLRRVLLSEINGLGIISVQIEGASHEYSNLDGIHEPVLDILLNLKELILKKTIKNFRPQIAYLNARGPGIVRASNIIFPPSIQCVDPDQYIATLSENGILNMKIYINYGNKWLMSSNKLVNNSNDLILRSKSIAKQLNGTKNQNMNNTISKTKDSVDFNFEKRSLIIKKLIQLGFISSNLYTEKLLKKSNYLLQTAKNIEKRKIQKFNQSKEINFKNIIKKGMYSGVSLKQLKNNLIFKRLDWNRSKRKKTNASYFLVEPNSLIIDSIFNPINKVNYVIEINDSKTSLKLSETASEALDFYSIIKSLNSLKNSNPNSQEDFLNTIDFSLPSSSPSNNNSLEEEKTSEERLKLKQENNFSSLLVSETKKKELSDLFELKKDVNMLKKQADKHNIILEIWTNGSIHPRDALYESFKKLVKTFSQLHKINPFLNSNFITKTTDLTLDSIDRKNYLLKQIKISKLGYLLNQNLIPLNEKYFIETYLAPNIKNFYIQNTNLDSTLNDNIVLNNKAKINFVEKHLIKTINLDKENIIPPTLFNNSTNKTIVNSFFKFENIEISYLKLSLPTFTFLRRLNISTVGELAGFFRMASKNDSRNPNYKQLNKTTMNEIKQILLKLDYTFF